jgi:hypothetical protein
MTTELVERFIEEYTLYGANADWLRKSHPKTTTELLNILLDPDQDTSVSPEKRVNWALWFIGLIGDPRISAELAWQFTNEVRHHLIAESRAGMDKIRRYLDGDRRFSMRKLKRAALATDATANKASWSAWQAWVAAAQAAWATWMAAASSKNVAAWAAEAAYSSTIAAAEATEALALAGADAQSARKRQLDIIRRAVLK